MRLALWFRILPLILITVLHIGFAIAFTLLGPATASTGVLMRALAIVFRYFMVSLGIHPYIGTPIHILENS